MEMEIFWARPEVLLMIASGLGALLGLERELSQKDASLRTFSLVCLGSCLFSILSVDAAQIAQQAVDYASVPVDHARIAAQIVSGVGFVGGGLIFRSESKTRGITTAVLIWVAAAIGMATGFGRLDLAVTSTTISLVVLVGFRVVRIYFRRLKFRDLDGSS